MAWPEVAAPPIGWLAKTGASDLPPAPRSVGVNRVIQGTGIQAAGDELWSAALATPPGILRSRPDRWRQSAISG